MIINEKEIIEKLNSDDPLTRDKTLHYIYKDLFPTIKSFITKNSGNKEDAADVFQDAIVIFYDKIRTKNFKLDCSIKTYVYSVSKYIWLNKLKKNKKIISLDEQIDEIKILPSEVEKSETSERQVELLKMIEKLGNKCKEILIYYYFDRIKMRQIAVKMNFANEQVAKNKKSHCLKKLKKMAVNLKNN